MEPHFYSEEVKGASIKLHLELSFELRAMEKFTRGGKRLSSYTNQFYFPTQGRNMELAPIQSAFPNYNGRSPGDCSPASRTSACNACLKTFRNQSFHALLNRHRLPRHALRRTRRVVRPAVCRDTPRRCLHFRFQPVSPPCNPRLHRTGLWPSYSHWKQARAMDCGASPEFWRSSNPHFRPRWPFNVTVSDECLQRHLFTGKNSLMKTSRLLTISGSRC